MFAYINALFVIDVQIYADRECGELKPFQRLCHSAVETLVESEVLLTIIGLLVMNLGADIHGPKRPNSYHFEDTQSFPLAEPWGQNLH